MNIEKKRIKTPFHNAQHFLKKILSISDLEVKGESTDEKALKCANVILIDKQK